MIRFQELVPDYYIEKSRDFQILCRLYDIAYNSTKFNIESMQTLTNTKKVKDSALPLVGDKFGVYDEQSYSIREMLIALPTALHYKGSLKSIKILLNAYLDALNEFTYAIAYDARGKNSAEYISSILNRKIDPYTIVIILSTRPSATKLNILETYLKMVVPTGVKIEYMFGTSYTIIDKFKYNENIFIFYTDKSNMNKIATNRTQYNAEILSSDNSFDKHIKQDVNINVVGLESVEKGDNV